VTANPRLALQIPPSTIAADSRNQAQCGVPRWSVATHGGVTMVQDPGEAEQPSMPLQAILHDSVKAILPLSRIAPVLEDLTRGIQLSS